MKPWNDKTFRQQAELVLDNVSGLSETDLEDVYSEWEELEFPDVPEGRTEALAALQSIAMKRVVENIGKSDDVEKRVGNWLQERDKVNDGTNSFSS